MLIITNILGSVTQGFKEVMSVNEQIMGTSNKNPLSFFYEVYDVRRLICLYISLAVANSYLLHPKRISKHKWLLISSGLCAMYSLIC